VVKLFEQYGVEVHQLLADAGMAPRILNCGLLDGEDDVRDAGSRARDSTTTGGLYACPVDMAVMEHIEGDTADKVSALPKNVREKTEEAIQKLHDAQLVFGDLRAPNVMLSQSIPDRFQLSWKSERGAIPPKPIGSVKWPKEAKESETEYISMDHDLFMLG